MKKKSKESERKEKPGPVFEAVREAVYERVTELSRELLLRNRAWFVAYVTNRLQGARGIHAEPSESIEWEQIESLSQFRQIVGGRFQNIREKWIASGFPLRRHKGDREQDYEIVPEGWQLFADWILKQGYEARLGSNADPYLFEVRTLQEQEPT